VRDWLETLHSEWCEIRNAPWSFAIAVLSTNAIVWAIIHWVHRNRFAALKSMIELLDRQIKEQGLRIREFAAHTDGVQHSVQ
jgi:hypothetical protein